MQLSGREGGALPHNGMMKITVNMLKEYEMLKTAESQLKWGGGLRNLLKPLNAYKGLEWEGGAYVFSE